MDRVPSNGSFLVKSTGAVDFTGSGFGDPNQIVTFNPDFGSLESTDLGELFGGACVSQYTPDPPSERPRGGDLEIGDFWTDSNTKYLSVWDGDKWVRIKCPEAVQVGTIINHINDGPLAPPPSGYLRCDGGICPPQFSALASLLFTNNGNTNLPSLPDGFFVKF